MTTAQVVETSVTVNNNSPIQDYVHPDDQTQPFFKLDFTKTIIPLALMASESITHSAFALMGYWLRAHSGSRNNCLI